MMGGATSTIRNVTSRCPRCSGRATIPDGRYIGGILQALRQSNLSTDDLIRLRDSIQSALTSQGPLQTSIAVNDVITAVPSLAARWTPQSPADRYALLAALLAALTIILGLHPAEINNTINNTINNVAFLQQGEPCGMGDGPKLP